MRDAGAFQYLLRNAASPANTSHRSASRLVKETWEAQANLSFFLALLVLFVFVLPLTSVVENHLNVYVDIAYSIMLLGRRDRLEPFWLFIWRWLWALLEWLCDGLPGGIRRYQVSRSFHAGGHPVAHPDAAGEVFRKGPVSGSRLQGAIAAYLLMGLGWAHAYVIFARNHPQSFVTSDATPPTVAGWTYFSFITLTTVGYGDIIPKAPVARMLAVAEALAGQLYLAVLVARLVALQVSNSVGANAEKNE